MRILAKSPWMYNGRNPYLFRYAVRDGPIKHLLRQYRCLERRIPPENPASGTDYDFIMSRFYRFVDHDSAAGYVFIANPRWKLWEIERKHEQYLAELQAGWYCRPGRLAQFNKLRRLVWF